jgi:hypothetical protein
MLPELKTWEVNSEERPELVIIASGTEQANRDLGLRSPIVLDHGSALMQALKVTGTPSGFLVGVDGRVESALVIGSAAIWSLVRAFGSTALSPVVPEDVRTSCAKTNSALK